MMKSILPVLLASLLAVLLADAAVTTDEVKYLPGLNPQPMFKHFSGYLNATSHRYLHYWFVESARNPSTDPVLVWLNGGPGCSSMEGMLNENGPFKLSDDGATLQYNKYSWNSVANVLYIEAPAGVGYSYSEDKNYKTDDDQASKDNYFAIMNFFAKFPEFRKNTFFISGESYGGIYVPTLSARVVENDMINFQGFAVGNGLSSWKLNDNSLLYFGYYHGIVSVNLWNKLVAECCKKGETICDFDGNTDLTCQNHRNEVKELLGQPGLNIYNLYGTCYTPKRNGQLADDGKVVFDYLPWLLSNSSERAQFQKTLQSVPKERLRVTPPCVNATGLHSYLNRADVKKALHIPEGLPTWEVCSGQVGAEYSTLYKTMTEQYKKVLAAKKRVLVYNGDVDMACNFLGDEWFVDSLGLEEVQARKTWYVNDDKTGTQQIAGFVRQLKNLVFTTIKGAGHMVPQDKPQQALEMLKRFLSGTPY
ncbi:lysosomal protective protein-like isoform X2 [Lineus longissimus]|uniref:lysosomal protective protein-like isoform X1 n=1 Tax=Lineus longissimus TaxID=88925 RepID=UPI00315C853F